MFLSEVTDVPQKLLTAVNLGLLKTHVLFQVVAKGGRQDVSANFSNPPFNRIFVLIVSHTGL